MSRAIFQIKSVSELRRMTLSELDSVHLNIALSRWMATWSGTQVDRQLLAVAEREREAKARS
jgi:hypothetical protein